MKTAYTYIFNNYDTLKQPVKTEGWKYICFTDNPDLYEKGIWQLEKVPIIDTPKKTACYYITHGLELFSTDIVLSVTGQCQIIGNLNDLIDDFLKRDYCIMRHPARNCTYREGEAILRHKRDIPGNVIPQILKYRAEGLPEHNGLAQCAVIGRRNIPAVKRFDARWWNELNTMSTREQLSFNYVLWRYPINIDYFEIEELNKYIEIHKHLKS